jgi:hypothetical protein
MFVVGICWCTTRIPLDSLKELMVLIFNKSNDSLNELMFLIVNKSNIEYKAIRDPQCFKPLEYRKFFSANQCGIPDRIHSVATPRMSLEMGLPDRSGGTIFRG